MVNIVRSRPVKVGRSRLMRCLGCAHRWGSIELTHDFVRDRLLRGDDEALRLLYRLVE